MLVAVYKGQTFDHRSWLGPEPFQTSPNVFIDCTFQGASVRTDLQKPARLVEQQIINATVRGGILTGAVVDNCVLDGLKVKNMPGIAGCVFRHVTIRGHIDQLIIHGSQQYLGRPDLAATEKALLEQHYADIDWALDISEVESPDFSIRGIPSSLIRWNRETQAVLDYDTAKSTDWTKFDLSGTNFRADIMLLLDRKSGDAVLVGATSGKTAEREQEVLASLRRSGLVS